MSLTSFKLEGDSSPFVYDIFIVVLIESQFLTLNFQDGVCDSASNR